jgi:hypothetical protein
MRLRNLDIFGILLNLVNNYTIVKKIDVIKYYDNTMTNDTLRNEFVNGNINCLLD